MHFYALQEVGTLNLLVIAQNEALLKKKIEDEYWRWHADQPEGCKTTIDEWLTNKMPIRVDFTPLIVNQPEENSGEESEQQAATEGALEQE